MIRRSDSSYGFTKDLPEGAEPAAVLRVGTVPAPPWCTTGMVRDAKNHCAAILAANLLLCLSGGERPIRREEAARLAYSSIGPGPIVRGIAIARHFLSENGIAVRSRHVATFPGIRRQFSAGRPVALLLVGPDVRTQWHWVLACGVTITQDGAKYLHIADGWNTDTRFFRNGVGSRCVAAASFERV